MPKQPTPQWHPITRLALIATHIDGMLESSTEQYETLQEARPTPWILDDYTVGRVISAFKVQQGDLWLFDEQLQRWQAETLDEAQRAEVARLVGQMKKLHEVIASILALTDELAEGTIEQQTAKSDMQLALEVLRKGWPTAR